MANEKFLSFDAEITQDAPENVLLPEGKYSFMVQGVEKGTYTGTSEKIGIGCPMVKLEILVRSPQGNASVRENFYLNTDFEWKLGSFFRCIGKKEHGKAYRMDWNCIGAEGLCQLVQRSYQNQDGKMVTVNAIKSFLESDAVKAPTAPDTSDVPFEV